MLQQPLDSFVIVPVGLAEQHCREAVGLELATFDKNLQGGVVVGFGRVIRSLPVIRIGAAFEQQACQLCVMSNSGSPIDRALPLSFRLVVGFVPAGVRVGARIEQCLRRAHKTI